MALQQSSIAAAGARPAETGIIGLIAGYIEDARDVDAPQPARQAAFRCLVDLLGAAAAGVAHSGVAAVRTAALNQMRDGRSPIWFTGRTASVIGAAWANSAAASALDLDDGHRLARGHPGAAVIPTALAVAEEVGSTLEELISAIVIGYEVGVSIGAARSTYGNTGTWSAYAVVATAGALRRTPRDKLEHALAIAGEGAPNQMFLSAPSMDPPPEGSDVKEGIPWSVVTGLIALDLAEAGHSGPRNILDSELHYRFPPGFKPGSALHIANTYFKLYACCRHVHAPLDALLGLMCEHSIDPGKIDAIEVQTYSGALRIPNKAEPDNLTEIQYSIPYCLALAAHLGPQPFLPLTPDSLHHREASALAHKVNLSLNPALDARFPAETLAQVTIFSGPNEFVSDITAPDGEASKPLSWTDLQNKLRSATRLVADQHQQSGILDAVEEARFGMLAALHHCLATLKLID